MNNVLHLFWLLAIVLPLLLAGAMLHRAWRQVLIDLTPWTTLPALALALLVQPGTMVDVSWLLLGIRLGLDETTRVFLVFTTVLWLCAGVYARRYMAQDTTPVRFFTFYLVTMSGNLGLILAQDMLSFFLFFALMSFAAYGLVIHTGTPEAAWAGRVYMILVVIGEVFLFSAIILLGSDTTVTYFQALPNRLAEVPTRHVIIALTLIGFGIKAGVVPLHVWLPLAHPAAPTPASAVLSGTMIKAGLLGWLRFLPLGELALPTWGAWCMAVGLLTAFYGVLVGITQDNPKTVLAYSSVSQMGLMTVVLGIGLAAPAHGSLVLTVILMYAVHHALAKGALFLGVGVAAEPLNTLWQRGVLVVGLVVPALALAGAPLTSGALVKAAFKTATVATSSPWYDVLNLVLPWTAVGTTLLVSRFLFVVWPRTQTEPGRMAAGLWGPWLVTLIGVAALTVLWPWGSAINIPKLLFTPKALRDAVWPVGLGVLLAVGAWGVARLGGWRLAPRLPTGDMLVPLTWLLVRIRQGWGVVLAAITDVWSAAVVRKWRTVQSGWQASTPLLRLEGWLDQWIVAGTIFLLLAAVLFALMSVVSWS